MKIVSERKTIRRIVFQSCSGLPENAENKNLEYFRPVEQTGNDLYAQQCSSLKSRCSIFLFVAPVLCELPGAEELKYTQKAQKVKNVLLI